MNPLSGLKLAAGITVATAGGLALYARTLRLKHVRWGATDEEIRRPMPLDDRVTGATYVTNRAVTVRARPEEIWLWLAQIGESPRAGYYSYEWVERLMGMDVKNTDAIFPEYQHPKAGDVLDRSGMMEVKAVEPHKWLILGPPEGLWLACTWCIALYPEDAETTRVVSRVRAEVKKWSPVAAIWIAMLDPGQFLMERKMLLEIKKRAEAMAAERQAHIHVFEEVLLEAMKYG